MIKMMPAQRLESIQKTLPINYAAYLRWLDEEPIDINYYVIGTSIADVRPRQEWNTKGREIFNQDKLDEYALMLNDFLDEMNLERFFVQHKYMNQKWFPEKEIKNPYARNQIKYLKAKIQEFDSNTFDGGFIIDGDMQGFFKMFIGYPFLLNYSDIDVFSLEQEILFTVNHHMSVNFISCSKELINKAIVLSKRYSFSTVRGDNTGSL